ncbi:MAG: AzlC family ABC transporter permease [Kiritimatiellae bacterium]|nr:AzlC family ABC transporter permease [Kiritimatiellia bacterium]
MSVSEPASRGLVARAFIASLPVLTGYTTMGFAAGLLLALQDGTAWSSLWAALTSAFFVSGPLQYLLVDWVRESTPYLAAVILVVCLNIRYSLYGLSLLDRFRAAPLGTRLYLIGTVTDETFALQTQCPWPAGEKSTRYCLMLALFDHLYWIVGVTAGALAGIFAQGIFSKARVEACTKGIDFAMTALFLVILVDQLRTKANRIPALIGILSSVAVFSALAPFMGFASARGNMLIPSMVLIVCVFLALRSWLDPERRATGKGASA